jgi:hypothetical protein
LSVRLPARPLRTTALVCGVVLSLGLAGCGRESNPSSAENDGVYETAGNVTYQLEVSRQLNQYSTEDSQYVKGVPATDSTLGPSALWYGVFLWAKNQTSSPQRTTDSFDIVDTVGHHYYPIPLNRSLNPFAWTAQTLQPNAIEPAASTIAANGPTQGALLLFKLNQSVYSDRPLTLEIRSPTTNRVEATISLDL